MVTLTCLFLLGGDKVILTCPFDSDDDMVKQTLVFHAFLQHYLVVGEVM